jgi:hypothetical protein
MTEAAQTGVVTVIVVVLLVVPVLRLVLLWAKEKHHD